MVTREWQFWKAPTGGEGLRKVDGDQRRPFRGPGRTGSHCSTVLDRGRSLAPSLPSLTYPAKEATPSLCCVIIRWG